MPVQKFRSIEECPSPPRPTDPDRILAKLAFVLSMAREVAPGRPTGVAKFLTLEEANAAREEWVGERMRRLRGSTSA